MESLNLQLFKAQSQNRFVNHFVQLFFHIWLFNVCKRMAVKLQAGVFHSWSWWLCLSNSTYRRHVEYPAVVAQNRLVS